MQKLYSDRRSAPLNRAKPRNSGRSSIIGDCIFVLRKFGAWLPLEMVVFQHHVRCCCALSQQLSFRFGLHKTTTRIVCEFLVLRFFGLPGSGMFGRLILQPCNLPRNTVAQKLGFHFFLLLDNTPLFFVGFSGCHFLGVWASLFRQGRVVTTCVTLFLSFLGLFISSAAARRPVWLAIFRFGGLWALGVDFPARQRCKLLRVTVAPCTSPTLSSAAPKHHTRRFFVFSFCGCRDLECSGVAFAARQACRKPFGTTAQHLWFLHFVACSIQRQQPAFFFVRFSVFVVGGLWAWLSRQCRVKCCCATLLRRVPSPTISSAAPSTRDFFFLFWGFFVFCVGLCLASVFPATPAESTLCHVFALCLGSNHFLGCSAQRNTTNFFGRFRLGALWGCWIFAFFCGSVSHYAAQYCCVLFRAKQFSCLVRSATFFLLV
jgi:hypothetical protein